MPDEHEHPERRENPDLTAKAERFEQYLEALLGGARPSPDDVTDRDEAEMARLAAELSAAAHPAEAAPNPAFVEQLRLRMRQADQGAEHVQVPPPIRIRDAGAAGPSASRGRLRLTRRELFGAVAGATVGLAAGASGYALVRRLLDGELGWEETDLVAEDRAGEWFPVVLDKDLSEGAVVRFSTTAFDGFVVNDGGEVRALSAACTHLGCRLQYRPRYRDLRCPCHGASFNLRGWLANGPEKWEEQGGYPGDQKPYPEELPPLARPKVRLAYGQVLVYTPRFSYPDSISRR
jgi:cytochrome b6-f complex iron-sulfur subunit